MKPPKTSKSTTRCRAGAPMMAALLLLGLGRTASAQHYTISSNWFVTNLVASTHVAAGDVNRSLAYSVSANQLFVCNKGVTGSGTTPAIDVFDGTAGTYIASANVTGVAGGTFLLDQVAVADDGKLYGANLTTSLGSTAYVLYQWTSYSTAPTVAFTGDPSGGTLAGKRMGDNLAIMGSGTSTVVLAPVEASGGNPALTNVVLFSTTDGSTFTPTLLNIAGMPAPTAGNGVVVGVTFYTNNGSVGTFLYKPNGTSLYLVQYPANFASLTSPVQATVIYTNASFTSGSALPLNYSAAGNLLAALGPIPNAAPTTTPINLYLANPLSSISSVGATNSAHANANGNFVGGVVLGGQGKTNLLFTLDCNNGVQGWGISFVPAPVSPTITTQPAGGSVYTTLGSFTFSVTGAGSTPLYYYWQYNTESNQATATTIAITTNNPAYTISPLTTAASGWYDVIVSNVAGTSNSAVVQLTVSTGLASPYVTQLWSLPADTSQPYLDQGYNTRGLAFDPSTMTVLLAEHSGDNIYALNALTGAFVSQVTSATTGLPEGSLFGVGQVGVADDGVLYVCNVSSYNPASDTAIPGTSDFAITRFGVATNSDSTNLSAAFTGDPGNFIPGGGYAYSGGDRWGDSMAVRGAGATTQILLGTYETIAGQFGTGPGTNVAILTTTDGMTFTPTTIAVTNAPSGFSYLGVAWGTNNTFWAKSAGFDLRQVQYNLSTGIGTVIQDFATAAGGGSLNGVAGIGLDNANNILAGVNLSDTPNDLELFQIPSAGFPPQAYYQDFFLTNNPNLNGNAATTIKFPYIFSLDANNGIIGLQYSIPLVTFPITAVSKSGNNVMLTWQTVVGHKYQVQYATSLPGHHASGWTNVGPQATASGTTMSYTDTTATTASRYYQVVGQ